MKMPYLKHWLLMANVSIIFLGVLVFGYLYFLDGAFTPEINISSLVTTKERYVRGDMVQVKASFCKRRESPISFQWTLYDDEVPPIPYKEKSASGVTKGCYEDRVSNVEIIPKYVVPGKYYFENRITYQINPVKSVEYIIKTNTFIIE